PASWRFIKHGDNNAEEMVFTLRGVIEGKELPPIFTEPKIPRNKYVYLQQSVTLTGLGTPMFEKSVQALAEIATVFNRQFPEGQMIPWHSSPSCLADGQSIVFSNRYFTRRKDGPLMKPVPFDQDVDPRGFLSRATNSQIIHTEENKVKYFRREKDTNTEVRYHPAEPQTFRVGDIVEIQFGLVVYKMRTESYILKPMLYSLALIDGQFANVCI
ncbi:hypothetical protein BDN72DRAFT_780099, partial [Pluteus cervinus]